MAAIVILWVLCAGLSWMIGNSKGRAIEGFWLGLFLSVIGLVITVCLKPATDVLDVPTRMMGESKAAYERRITEAFSDPDDEP